MLADLNVHIQGYELVVLVINRGGLFQLQFLNSEGDRVSIDIPATSVGKKNWEVSSKEGVINNLNVTIDKFTFA